MLLEQMLLEERNEGIEKGIEIGTERGIEIGTKRGIEIGTETSLRKLAARLWEKGYPIEDIAELCDKGFDVVKSWIAEDKTKK